jgi:hypothetical protein
MAISLQQTDAAAIDGAMAACSGRSAAQTTDNKQATQNGTAGTTSPTITLAANSSNVRGVHFESANNEPNLTSWPAGNWTVRINVTSPNTNITWTECYICRVNSSGVSQATVGSLTGQSLSLVSGVASMTISGSAQTANATDRVYILCVFSNSTGVQQSFNYKPNQLIDTPLTAATIFFFQSKRAKRLQKQLTKKRRRDHSWMHHPQRSPPLWPFSQSRQAKKSPRKPIRKWLSKKSGTVNLVSTFSKLCGHSLITEDLRGTALTAESLASLSLKSKETVEAVMPFLSATALMVECIGKTGSIIGVKGTSAKVTESLSATATTECCK